MNRHLPASMANEHLGPRVLERGKGAARHSALPLSVYSDLDQGAKRELERVQDLRHFRSSPARVLAGHILGCLCASNQWAGTWGLFSGKHGWS